LVIYKGYFYLININWGYPGDFTKSRKGVLHSQLRSSVALTPLAFIKYKMGLPGFEFPKILRKFIQFGGLNEVNALLKFFYKIFRKDLPGSHGFFGKAFSVLPPKPRRLDQATP